MIGRTRHTHSCPRRRNARENLIDAVPLRIVLGVKKALTKHPVTLQKRPFTTPPLRKREQTLKKRPATGRPAAPARPDHEGVFRFPDEKSARVWFEGIRWSAGRVCPSCFSLDTQPVPQAKPMPYRCRDCRKYFSVRIGTVMQSSRLPLRTWANSLSLMTTHPRGVSLRQLQRALGMAQSSAWRVGRQIRTAWQAYVAARLTNPVRER